MQHFFHVRPQDQDVNQSIGKSTEDEKRVGGGATLPPVPVDQVRLQQNQVSFCLLQHY